MDPVTVEFEEQQRPLKSVSIRAGGDRSGGVVCRKSAGGKIIISCEDGAGGMLFDFDIDDAYVFLESSLKMVVQEIKARSLRA